MAKAKSASPMVAIKKHYFWIVISAVVIVAFAVTIMARGSIKKSYTEKKTAVEGEKQNNDTIATNNKHPNEQTIDAIKAETDILKKSVFEAWTLMYDDQKAKNRWPRQLPPDLLDLVENKLKFRDPIGVGNPRLLEDYAYFIDKNLPELLKKIGRRRCQVRDYKLLKTEDLERLGVSNAGSREVQFWPVYVDETNKRYYIRFTADGQEDGAVEDIFLYDVKDEILSNVADSAERDELENLERKPYYREVDPWLVYPKDYMTYGLDTSSLSFGDAMGGGMGGGLAGPSGGMGGGMMGPSGGKGGAGGMGGGARGGASAAGGMGMGGGMGMDGGMGMGMGGMSSGMGTDYVPGDGVDPAIQQLTGSTGNQNMGGDMGGGMGGSTGGGRRGGAAGGGLSGGPSGGMGGGLGAGPAGGGAMGGMGGMGGGLGAGAGMSADNYPGLPPYSERRRVVGNVDWLEPEIYGLPTWEAEANPLSIEVWYAQETLWVYDALIRIVAETNKEAGDNIALAPIKCVEAMLIGATAASEWTYLTQAIGDVTGEASSMMGGGLMGEAMGGGMGGTGGAGGAGGSGASGGPSGGGMGAMGSMGAMGGSAAPMTPAEEEAMKLDMILYGRYIDLDDAPLMPTDKPPFAEFNRMPICLKLVVDQRRIPDVLVNCANSSMPIDITHVRICPDTAVPFTMPTPSGGGDMMGGGMGAMGGGMMGPSGGMGGMGAAGGAAAAGGGKSGGAASEGARGSLGGGMGMGGMGGEGSIDIGRSELSQVGGYGVDAIRVEIYGIINIFNEPDLNKFGTGKDAEDSEASDTTMTEETLDVPSVAEHQAADASNGATSTDPNATPADPNATPVDPNAAPADPNATPVDPNATPVDPNAAPADPNATPADPNATPVDPNAAPTDPNAAPTDPNAAAPAP